jgi:long-chain acyl-CoA synthetase
MFFNVTTVAFYDTLGPDATKFCVDQTQVSSISCSVDCVEKLAKLKKEDHEGKMNTLQNIVAFAPGNDVSDNLKMVCDEAGIKLYSFQEVIRNGQ